MLQGVFEAILKYKLRTLSDWGRRNVKFRALCSVLSYSSHSSMICHWQCQVVVSSFLRMIVFFIAQFLRRLIVKLSRQISQILRHGSESRVGLCLLILINATLSFLRRNLKLCLHERLLAYLSPDTITGDDGRHTNRCRGGCRLKWNMSQFLLRSDTVIYGKLRGSHSAPSR